MKLYRRGGMGPQYFIGALTDSGRFYYIDKGWVQKSWYERSDNFHLFCTEPVPKSEEALMLFPIFMMEILCIFPAMDINSSRHGRRNSQILQSSCMIQQHF